MSGRAAGFLRIAAGLGLWCLALGLGACSKVAPPPDLLLISLDTLRADRLSCYGYHRRTSPFLDALAARGTRFARCLAPAPHTAPSHMSAFTGLDPHAHGVVNARATSKNVTRLSDDAPLLAEQLEAAGYYTAIVSEGGNVRPEMGFGRGFHKRGFAMAPIEFKLSEAAAVLEAAAADRPVFLFFHTYLIHSPYLPPEEFFGRFADRSYRGVFRQRYQKLVGAPVLAAWAEAAKFLDVEGEPSPADLEFLSALYDEGILHADAQVARLWDSWTKRRDGDNTLVAVFSDHGEEFMEHGLLGHRRGLFGPLVHVPMLFAGPGVPVGRVVETPVNLTALGATVLDALDLDPTPLARSGVMPLMARDAPPATPYGQAAYSKAYGRAESVEFAGRRLLRVAQGGEVRLLLFDPSLDPMDQRDLSAAEGHRVEELRALLDARLLSNLELSAELPASDRGELGAGAGRELEALGYTGD